MRLADLPTPALILDRQVLQRNLAAMQDRARLLGVRLRPHLKTAKSAEVARLALGPGRDGITVSTLSEARYFLAKGFRDLTYAIAITPDKFAEVARLLRAGAELTIITDDIPTARALGAYGKSQGLTIPVLIEIDTGQGRGGLVPEEPTLVPLGEILHRSGGTSLQGVLTHAGHSYRCRSLGEIAAVAEIERAGAVAAADRLRGAGLPCPVVSVGSTPTALQAEHLAGVSEIRPGVYMFMDLFQASLGLCQPADIAVSVLTAVIGHKSKQARLLVDAGALALSQDQSRPGFGRVQGLPLHVAEVNQEHGFIAADTAEDLPPQPVGTRFRILPNHSCMTAAMHGQYHVVDGSDTVLAVWERCRGW